MNVIGASILSILIVVVFMAPRRWALVGMMAGVLYLTQGQVINVSGFHLFAIRLLELAGLGRLLTRREFSFSNLNGIDRAILLLYLYSTLVFLIRSNVEQANHIGMMVDACLCYFTFRALITSIDDLRWFLCVFVILLIPYVALVSVEMQTHVNPFAAIGGASSNMEREGRLRCIGSFRHPSLFGTLGATFLPLYFALFLDRKYRIRAFFGTGLCLAIVFLSNSGGPLSAAATGMFGWIFWYIRPYMSLVRRLLVCLLIILACIMKAPVWYLPAKLSSFTGGDGWHRSRLMEVAFNDIDKWWLTGMDLQLTRDWFPYRLESGVADITNQYLAFGLQAGLLSMAFFILILTRSFQAIGRALSVDRSDVTMSNNTEYLIWGFGCALLVHISTWLGITYSFDQTYVIWFMQLAAISSIEQGGIDTNIKITQDIDLRQNRVMQSIYRKNIANSLGCRTCYRYKKD